MSPPLDAPQNIAGLANNGNRVHSRTQLGKRCGGRHQNAADERTPEACLQRDDVGRPREAGRRGQDNRRGSRHCSQSKTSSVATAGSPKPLGGWSFYVAPARGGGPVQQHRHAHEILRAPGRALVGVGAWASEKPAPVDRP